MLLVNRGWAGGGGVLAFLWDSPFLSLLLFGFQLMDEWHGR